MNKGIFFSVHQEEGLTRFENHTDFNLVIYVKPIKPKRKYQTGVIVFPQEFKVFDCKDMTLDLTVLSFSLEQP